MVFDQEHEHRSEFVQTPCIVRGNGAGGSLWTGLECGSAGRPDVLRTAGVRPEHRIRSARRERDFRIGRVATGWRKDGRLTDLRVGALP